MAPSQVRQILDGPFHSQSGERLAEARAGGLMEQSPHLADRCPGCDKVVFRFAGRTTADLPDIYKVRAQALMELQRMHRTGAHIIGPRLALQKPLYWKKMSPP
jgi:hypothetical protein